MPLRKPQLSLACEEEDDEDESESESESVAIPASQQNGGGGGGGGCGGGDGSSGSGSCCGGCGAIIAHDHDGREIARLESLLSDAVSACFSLDPPPADCVCFVGDALVQASGQSEAGARLTEQLQALVNARSQESAWTDERGALQVEAREAAARLREYHASRPTPWLVDATATELTERAMELQTLEASSQADAARALAEEEARAGQPLSPPERLTLTLAGRARMPQQARVLGVYAVLPHAIHGRPAFSKEDDARVVLSWAPEAAKTDGGDGDDVASGRLGEGAWVVWFHPEPGEEEGKEEGADEEGADEEGKPSRAPVQLLFVRGEAADASRATGVWHMAGQRGGYKRPGIRCYRTEARQAELGRRDALQAELRQLGWWQLLTSAELVRRNAEAAETERAPPLRALGRSLRTIRETAAQPLLVSTPRSDERDEVVASLRRTLRAAQGLVGEAQVAIEHVASALPATSRAAYLRSLRELLGAPPTSGTWEDEWPALRADKMRVSVDSLRGGSWGLEHTKATNAADIEQLVARGWPREDATATICLLETFPSQLAKALRERDPAYARATFALHDSICRAALRQHTVGGAPTPPTLYMNLRAKVGSSLVNGDPRWAELLEADRTGFRGLSSSVAIAEAHCDPRCFSAAGYCKRIMSADGVYFKPVGGDVVAFESRANDELGLHGCGPLFHIYLHV